RWAHSDYRPQKNSTYSASGDAFEVEAGARFLFGMHDPVTTRTLDVQARSVSVDPRSDPLPPYYPTPGGIASPLWVSPNFSYFSDLYSLHGTQRYTHSREGVEAAVTWVFDGDILAPMEPHGYLYLRYGRFDQKATSLQDVRFSAGALGA